MRKSKRPAALPVDPDLIPKADESPEFERQELSSSAGDPEQAPAESEPEAEPEPAYDDNGEPYPQEQEPGQEQEHSYDEACAAEQEQAYDENGQPYPHPQEPAYDEHETAPYDAAQAAAYETAPMTGPPHMVQQHMVQQHMVQQHMVQHMQHMQHMQQPMQGGPPNLHGGPYRIPPYDPNAFYPAKGVPIPRPLIGSAIAVYGVLLWSFVVAGQFATSWISGSPMDQGLAVFIVFVSTLIAWIVAARRSRAALPTTTTGNFVGRSLAIGALAVGAFFLTLVGTAIVGPASGRGPSHDFFFAFVLVAIAVTASALGPRITHPLRPVPSHGMRFAVVMMWVASAIVTFIAGAELATNG